MCAKNEKDNLQEFFKKFKIDPHNFITSMDEEIKNNPSNKYFEYLDDLIRYENNKLSCVKEYPEFNEIVRKVRKKYKVDESMFVKNIIENGNDLGTDTTSRIENKLKLIKDQLDSGEFQEDFHTLKMKYDPDRINILLSNFITFNYKQIIENEPKKKSKENADKIEKKAKKQLKDLEKESEDNEKMIINKSREKKKDIKWQLKGNKSEIDRRLELNEEELTRKLKENEENFRNKSEDMEKEFKKKLKENEELLKNKLAENDFGEIIKQGFIINENDACFQSLKEKYITLDDKRIEDLKLRIKEDFIEYAVLNTRCILDSYINRNTKFFEYYYDWDSFVLIKDKFIIELDEFFSKGENAVYRNSINYILICYYIFFNRKITLEELRGIYSNKHFDYKDYIESVSIKLDKIKKRKKFEELMKNMRDAIYKPIPYNKYFCEHYVAEAYEIPFIEDFNELFKYCKDRDVLADKNVDYIFICYYVFFNRIITEDKLSRICKDIDVDYKDFIEKVSDGFNKMKKEKKFKELMENLRKDIRDENFSIIIEPYNKFRRYVYEGCVFAEDEVQLSNSFNELYKYCKDKNVLADNDVDYIFLYYYVLFKRSIAVEELDLLYKNRDGGYKEILEKASDVLEILKSNNDFKEIVTNIRKEFGINDENSVKSIADTYNKYFHYLYKYSIFEDKGIDFFQDMHRIFDCCSEFLNYDNKFDYLLVYTHVMLDEELRVDKVFDMFRTGVVEFHSGEDLILNRNLDRRHLYMQVPIFTTNSYLNCMAPLIVAKAVDHYGLSRKEFRQLPHTYYKNKYIYEFVSKYTTEDNIIKKFDELDDEIISEIVSELNNEYKEGLKDKKYSNVKEDNIPCGTEEEKRADRSIGSDIEDIKRAIGNFLKQREEFKKKRLR